jgi:hypothetical protein
VESGKILNWKRPKTEDLNKIFKKRNWNK